MANAFCKKQEDEMRVIKVEGGREEEKEVIVRHGMISSKWKAWKHENFSRNWSEKYSL